MGLNEYAALLLGVVCAAVGGELFVRGTVGLALWARISPGIVAATVAAFSTSSPELSVSVNAALAGTPQISLGDALGSNVVNIALILALALLIADIRSPRDALKRDFPVALLIPMVTAVLALDGILSRIDGLVLLAAFFSWLAATFLEGRRQRDRADAAQARERGGRALGLCIAGLAFLVTAGYLIVTGARGIAVRFGIDGFVIGATVVAISTSVPELATTVVARLRGHDDVALGAILGSNIFNGLFVIGIAAVIFPIVVDWRDVAVVLVVGLLAVAFVYPARNGSISRRRGVLLLVLYGMYLTAVIQPHAA